MELFEKVNPAHPDKVADRIAGAVVDMAYALERDPRIAVEVLIGHGRCHVIAETSVEIPTQKVSAAVHRIAGDVECDIQLVPQDAHLAGNQERGLRCGDNGIFRGCPVTGEQKALASIARAIYQAYPTDGKYVTDGKRLVICQSNADERHLRHAFAGAVVNPLGHWTGGTEVDTGATNRKLGSDMGDAVTGGGIHGKDLSKADVSVNVWAHIEAQRRGEPVEVSCAIGDAEVDGVPYAEIVDTARKYIHKLGGFERLAEWGLI